SNCPRCLTHPDHRGDMRHAGIGSYPAQQPAAVDEAILSRASKALLSARSHIGAIRPDDEDDAAWWDELSELAAALSQQPADTVVGYITHSEDAVTSVNLLPAAMELGLGKHPIYAGVSQKEKQPAKRRFIGQKEEKKDGG